MHLYTNELFSFKYHWLYNMINDTLYTNYLFLKAFTKYNASYIPNISDYCHVKYFLQKIKFNKIR